MKRILKKDVKNVNEYCIYIVVSFQYVKSIIVKAFNKDGEVGWVSVVLESPHFGMTDNIVSTWYPTLEKRVAMSVFDDEVFSVFEFANMSEVAKNWNNLHWMTEKSYIENFLLLQTSN